MDWSQLGTDEGSYVENLKRRLKEHGISQNAMAREMGVTPPEFSRWMVGRVTPRLDTVVRIEQALAAIIKYRGAAPTKPRQKRSRKRK